MYTKYYIILGILFLIIILFVSYNLLGRSKLTASKERFDSDKEKIEILERSNWLCGQIIGTPKDLLGKMPAMLGPDFGGEWAIYSCAYSVAALSNICKLYPDEKVLCTERMHQIIDIALTPTLRGYDTRAWGSDALKTMDDDEGHMTYISLIAWMITTYKICSGSDSFDKVMTECCETLYRRMQLAPNLSLPSFPGTVVYIPDMLVTIVALNNYGIITHEKKYFQIVTEWLELADTEFKDELTGLWISALDNSTSEQLMSVRGSYAALTCYYLSLIDEQLAKEQYNLMKLFLRKNNYYIGAKISGVKEYMHRSPILKFDVDAGPILLGYSPSGTAWAIGTATYFEDWEFRYHMLLTAELAGYSIRRGGKMHYKLGEFALVGEAVVLAMRTHCPPRGA